MARPVKTNCFSPSAMNRLMMCLSLQTKVRYNWKPSEREREREWERGGGEKRKKDIRFKPTLSLTVFFWQKFNYWLIYVSQHQHHTCNKEKVIHVNIFKNSILIISFKSFNALNQLIDVLPRLFFTSPRLLFLITLLHHRGGNLIIFKIEELTRLWIQVRF